MRDERLMAFTGRQFSANKSEEETIRRGPEERDLFSRPKLFFMLMSLALLGLMAGLPNEIESFSRKSSDDIGVGRFLFYQSVALALTVGIASLGFPDRRRIGLGDPILESFFAKTPISFSLAIRPLLISGGLGFVVGAMVFFAAGELFAHEIANGPDLDRSAWQAALGAVGAGIQEEMIFRLGMMTWFVGVVGRHFQKLSQGWTLSIANVLAAVAFAAVHLPQVASHIIPTLEIYMFVFFGNLALGLLFGSLYCRFGFLSAVFGHIAAGIALHVVL